MNVKYENEPAIVEATARLLVASRMVGEARDRVREFVESGRTTSGVVIQITDNGGGRRKTLASTNEVIAALAVIDAEAKA